MIPLYKPYMPELPEMDEILRSGALAYGRYAKAFEEALKRFFGTDLLIAANSFNTAISVAITTLGLAPGDEIIASPMGCLASTQPYASSGLTVCWADIDPMRGTLDPDSVEASLTGRTRCIVHNHFCGYPGYIEEINEIGKKHGVPVIDDGIECFGSEYRGRRIGNCGTDVTVFSFTAVRMPNTIDGGCVIFRDKAQYEKSLLIRDCGIDRSVFRDGTGEISPSCDIKLTGFSATMSNVNGYIGLRQMGDVDKLISRQRRQAAVWDRRLSASSAYIPIKHKDSLPNYWIYGLLAPDKREAIRSFREEGYYASGVHINNNRYSVFGGLRNLKGVEDFYSRFVALPCGWWMTDD